MSEKLDTNSKLIKNLHQKNDSLNTIISVKPKKDTVVIKEIIYQNKIKNHENTINNNNNTPNFANKDKNKLDSQINDSISNSQNTIANQNNEFNINKNDTLIDSQYLSENKNNIVQENITDDFYEIKTEKLYLSENLNIKKSEIEELALLTNNFKKEDIDFKKLYKKPREKIKKREKIFNGQFTVGLNVAGLYNNRFSKKPHKPPLSPYVDKKPEISIFSYEFTATTSYIINNTFEISSGLNYSIIKHKFNHNINFEYDAQSEIKQASGDFKSTNSEDLPDSYGYNKADFFVIRPKNISIDDGEEINMNIATKHQVKMINVPLIFKYHILKKRVGITLNTGVVGNLIFENSESMVLANILDDRLISYETKIVNPMIKKRIDFSYLLGFGVNFKLTKNINLYVEPTFKSFITKPYKSNPDKTKPFSIATYFGIQYFI